MIWLDELLADSRKVRGQRTERSSPTCQDLHDEIQRSGGLVTPEQRRAVIEMAMLPGRGRAMSPDEFRAVPGVGDPKEWAINEIRGAIECHDADDAEFAFAIGQVFGLDERWLQPLITLLESDWHVLHEDAAFALGSLGRAEAVPALVHAAEWVPEYLDFDENRTLAVKAIHSLGKIPGQEAAAALGYLARHEDAPLRDRAERILSRRKSQDP